MIKRLVSCGGSAASTAGDGCFAQRARAIASAVALLVQIRQAPTMPAVARFTLADGGLDQLPQLRAAQCSRPCVPSQDAKPTAMSGGRGLPWL